MDRKRNITSVAPAIRSAQRQGVVMVQLLIMSLLVTLCLERISPVNLMKSATDRYVAIMPEHISSNEARIVWDALIER